jgi:hypothetical protein
MTFFVILNKKSHVASKKSYCFDFALNRRGRSSTGVPLNHTAATRRRTFDHQQQLIQKGFEKGINMQDRRVIQKDSDFSYDRCNAEPYVSALAAAM